MSIQLSRNTKFCLAIQNFVWRYKIFCLIILYDNFVWAWGVCLFLIDEQMDGWMDGSIDLQF